LEGENEAMDTHEFGCGQCWPSDADAAWKARASLEKVDDLIDESHFHVMILACNQCAQRYISVFTETIDWIDGEDPQYWTVLPITLPEADALVEQRSRLSEEKLNLLGPARRCLRRDHPAAQPPMLYWATGLYVGEHD
jgi:hypothetical protein